MDLAGASHTLISIRNAALGGLIPCIAAGLNTTECGLKGVTAATMKRWGARWLPAAHQSAAHKARGGRSLRPPFDDPRPPLPYPLTASSRLLATLTPSLLDVLHACSSPSAGSAQARPESVWQRLRRACLLPLCILSPLALASVAPLTLFSIRWAPHRPDGPSIE